jgi:lipid-A-disaccharide synthase
MIESGREASPPEILVSAGEASSEMYAAQLAAALSKRTGAHLFGLGGQRMREAGVEMVADCSEVAVVGITEFFSRVPAGFKILRRLEREAVKRKPALAIVVDSPALNLRLARRLRRHGIRIVYFVSPQIWAWRRRRVNLIRRRVARMLVIFPFEEKFYRDAGVPVDFVGHPLVDCVRATMTRAGFAARYGLDPQRPIVALLPGSRPKEVGYNLPGILEACRRLARDLNPQFVIAVAPGLPAAQFDGLAFEGLNAKRIEGATYDALAAADCAIISSGTGTVEAALLGVPMVVVYRVSRITASIARRLLHTPFFAMVNLIAGRRVVPELIQDDFTAEALERETRRLLASPEGREAMKQELAGVRCQLGSGGAIERAAEIISGML